MNPWLIIAFLVALGASYLGGEHNGHKSGVAEQKASDQGEFDKVNKQLADNKAEANKLYQAKQAENIALAIERDKLKTQLEQERQANEKVNNDLRTKYAGLKLRFSVPSDGNGRLGGGSAATAASSATSAAASSIVVELPDPLASDLRKLAFDADELRTAYGVCYGYATQVK